MVEELRVLLHDPVQMSFAQDQDVVEALTSQTAQEALTDRVRFGRPEWCFQHIDPCGYLLERRAVLAIIF